MLFEKFGTKTTDTPPAAADEIVIVNPAAEIQDISLPIAPRLGSLRGARVGIVDNAKRMALPLLKALESILQAEYGVASFNYYRKENASIPMPKDAMDAMAKASDAVVHGVADCGSCVTWGLYDSVEFEKLGVPAVNVITTGFSAAAKVRARTLGMQDHPIVAVQHPLANRTTPEVEDFAKQIVHQVTSGLLHNHQ
jgi:hypothetical protein